MKRAAFTAHLSLALLDRARSLVDTTPGLTLTGLIVAGITRAVDRLEKLNGGPYPKRKGPLKKGRPAFKETGANEARETVARYLTMDEELGERLRNAVYWNPKLRIQTELERELEVEIVKREKGRK